MVLGATFIQGVRTMCEVQTLGNVTCNQLLLTPFHGAPDAKKTPSCVWIYVYTCEATCNQHLLASI